MEKVIKDKLYISKAAKLELIVKATATTGLIETEFEGVVVQSDPRLNSQPGYFSHKWEMEDFKEYKGELKPVKNYLITIVFVDSKESITINPKEHMLDSCITSNFGGWDNLNVASTSSDKLEKGNYQQAGTTKDGKKLFSILCF